MYSSEQPPGLRWHFRFLCTHNECLEPNTHSSITQTPHAMSPNANMSWVDYHVQRIITTMKRYVMFVSTILLSPHDTISYDKPVYIAFFCTFLYNTMVTVHRYI